MSTIHFIGGEKGGVGKSLMARILAQYFIDHGQTFLGFDCDRTHGALLRFYTQYSAALAIDDYQSLDRLVDLAVAQPARAILVDLAAQAQQPLSRWMTDSRLLELAPDLKISLVYWHVMDNGFDSVELLRQLLDQFGQKIKLVLVLNQLRGERFEQLETSGQRTRAQQMGASSMPLQRLADATMQKIDANSRSFWAAMNNGAGVDGTLGLLEQQRLWVWIKRTYEEIDRIGV
jgi:CobQ/CobB/MinD/ParA nucleotide binding domain